MDLQSTPFAALSLIVAPAVLTNACSVLALSTSNRLARAVDHAREVHRTLNEPVHLQGFDPAFQLRDLRATHRRILMLIRALRAFYSALGGFAGCALLSVLGATFFPYASYRLGGVLEAIAVLAGTGAVLTLLSGVVLIIRETKIVVEVLEEQARIIERHVS